jgi:hypothetical protein
VENKMLPDWLIIYKASVFFNNYLNNLNFNNKSDKIKMLPDAFALILSFFFKLRVCVGPGVSGKKSLPLASFSYLKKKLKSKKKERRYCQWRAAIRILKFLILSLLIIIKKI